jgi:hypothetical protein
VRTDDILILQVKLRMAQMFKEIVQHPKPDIMIQAISAI